MRPSDPRKIPNAYVSDGQRLYQVLDTTPARNLILEDCCEFTQRTIEAWRVCAWPWHLVKAAPPQSCPDFPPE